MERWRPPTTSCRSIGPAPFVEALGERVIEQGGGPTHLPEEFELARETFRRFAEDQIRPAAEHVHRSNGDVPEEIIKGLAELGGFGLSVPEEYGGLASGGESDYLGMVVATEELSWGSLGIGGSLITRPEILTRAIVKGGTDEQKQRWLPRIATGELMVSVMVTEPDFGSDAAAVSVAATPAEGGWKIRGVKTWATFAGRANTLMLLARTDPDKSKAHRGLSLFVVDKPEAPGHEFRFDAGRRRNDAGPGHRHHRVPRDALLRSGVRRLVRPRREPRRVARRGGQGLLPDDGGVRERPAPDGGAGRRRHAGRLRGRPRLRAGAGRLRRAHCPSTSSRRRSSPAWRP